MAPTHSKNAATGKGQVAKTPGNAGLGNSMHTPQLGKPKQDYSSEQQQ